MVDLLTRIFRRNVVVRISPSRLWMRDPVADLTFDEPPLMAISAPPRRTVLAIGREALALRGKPGVTVVNPFEHPRTPIADFIIAEQILKHVLRGKLGRRMFLPAPAMVIGLDSEPEGGLTPIEIRALKELAIGAGASRSYVWNGPRLSDEQVVQLRFPTTGDVLE